MLHITRTRSGQLVVAALLVLVTGLVVLLANDVSESDGERGSAIVSALRENVFGRRAPAYKGRTRSKDRAKLAEEKAAAAAGVQEFKTSSTLRGTTFDEAGKPLAGVKIAVRHAGMTENLKTVTSNDKGLFSVDSLTADTYDVLASHDKFVPLIRPSLTIAAHQEAVAIDFHMPLGASIKGIVKNEDGTPLSGVRVAARRQKADESKETGEVLMDDSTYHTQFTDTPGTFTLTGISQGPNIFEFHLPGYAIERQTVDITPEKAAEQMAITLKKTGTLVGVVLDESNQPISTATVSLTRFKPLRGKGEAIDKDKLKVTTNEKGEFRFEKLFNEGYYDLLVEEPSFAPGIFPLVAVNSDRITCQLGIGGEISGKTELIDRETTAVSVLVRATAVVKGTTFTQEARSNGNGVFKFTKLPYGAYNLKVEDGKYVSEPKDGVACEREKPAENVAMELYEAAVVTGRVTNSESEGPVPGAKVTLQATYGFKTQKNKTFTVTADGHGLFKFPRVPSGVHVAKAEARGFLKGETSKSQQNFVLEPGERKSDLILFLDHGGTVEGFVLDPDGRSVDAAEIQLFAASQFDGQVNPANWKGRTDSTGYFKIWGIEVGERVQLYASASKKGYTKTRSDLIELSPKTMSQAVQINLSRGGQITGIVTDENKLPIPGAEVSFNSSAFPGDPTPSNLVVHTQPNGTYRLENCPPGGASVKVSRSGYVSQSRGLTIRNEQTADNTNFSLEAGNMISGVVEDLDGYPIAGARVTATGLNGAAGSETDTTNKRGEFELNNLGRGDFRLDATFEIKTQEGAQTYTFTNPKVRAGTVQASIDCDLGNTTSGKVKGEKGRGVPNFTITLRSKTDIKPSQDFVFNLSRGLKDAAGYFRMSKLPRGLYSMTVTADGYEPHELKEIAIGPHRRTVLPEIRLHPAGGVVGRVFSSTSDRPVNNASVRLESVDHLPNTGGPRVCAGTTNMRGEFRVSTVPEGTYKVSINHPSYVGMKMEMIQVTEKRERNLGKLYLEPGGTVRGTVVNHLGDPVPNMQVQVKGVTPAKQATTDAAGNYLIQGVQFGRWPVVVNGNMSGKPMYVFQTSDIQRDETKRLDFMLEQTSNLEGRLLASGETAVQSAKVQIHPFDENNVVLENVHYGANARSNQYNINEVPPGQYYLWVAGQSQNGSLAAWKDVFLQRGRNRADVHVGSSKLSGKVVNSEGQAQANVAVQLLPIFNAPQLTHNLYNKLIKPVVSDENGSFTFHNVQPGTYQLLNQDLTGVNWYAQPTFQVANGQGFEALNILVNH